jgi:hypothetical protein
VIDIGVAASAAISSLAFFTLHAALKTCAFLSTPFPQLLRSPRLRSLRASHRAALLRQHWRRRSISRGITPYRASFFCLNSAYARSYRSSFLSNGIDGDLVNLKAAKPVSLM